MKLKLWNMPMYKFVAVQSHKSIQPRYLKNAKANSKVSFKIDAVLFSSKFTLFDANVFFSQ